MLTFIYVYGWPKGSASSGLQVARYNFLWENWNSDPKQPIFRHTWRHIRVWSSYLYTASLQRPSSGLILFMIRIEILTLKNLTFWHRWRHIRVWHLNLYLAGLQDQPRAASKLSGIFNERIEIWTLKTYI